MIIDILTFLNVLVEQSVKESSLR